MPREPTLDEITEAAGRGAAERDRDGAFPRDAFDALHAHGVIGRPPTGPGEARRLLALLSAVGRGDLSVGRILEGHVNVLLLLDLFGDDVLRDSYRGQAEAGALFGVWNTDRPGDPVTLDGDRLGGSKTFCTGVDGLSHAVITADTPHGRQMVLVSLDGRAVDRSWWTPLGMRASGSHVVDFAGVTADAAARLGGPDDYVAQPWFSAGAMRFLAVQVGGVHGLLDIAREHLMRTGRAGDPYQRQRLARLGALVETGWLWLARCASSWDALGLAPRSANAAEAVATVNMARGVIEAAALEALELVERSVGAAGMIAPHPLERRIRDLRTYLRQPNPDGALAAAGEAVAEGLWTPGSFSGDAL